MAIGGGCFVHDEPRVCWGTVTGHDAGCWRSSGRKLLRYGGESIHLPYEVPSCVIRSININSTSIISCVLLIFSNQYSCGLRTEGVISDWLNTRAVIRHEFATTSYNLLLYHVPRMYHTRYWYTLRVITTPHVFIAWRNLPYRLLLRSGSGATSFFSGSPQQC